MLTPNVLTVLIQMRLAGCLEKLNSVADLGDQQLHLRGFEGLIERFLVTFGAESAHMSKEEVRKLTVGPARKIYEKVGARYVCLDTARPIDDDGGHHVVTLFDLNYQQIQEDLKSQFDLLLNIGVTEHVINQLNCFKCCHDLTVAGGYMFHIVPCLGFSSQYYFNYQPQFFEELAEANGYSVHGMWITLPGLDDHLIPWQRNLLPLVRWDATYDKYAHISVMLRKQFEAEFRLPFQGQYQIIRQNEVSRAYQPVISTPRDERELVGTIPRDILLGEVWRRAKEKLKGVPRTLIG